MRSKKRQRLADLPPLVILSPQPQSQTQPQTPAAGRRTKTGRKRSLLWAWWISLPLALALALVGCTLLGLQISALTAARDYRDQDQIVRARQLYAREVQWQWRPVQWVGQYNLGTVYLRQNEPKRAVDWLEKALVGVPKAVTTNETMQAYSYECQVRVNLALAWEAMGDGIEKDQGADPAQNEERQNQMYQRALGLIEPCATPPHSQDQSDDDSEESPDSESPDSEEEQQGQQQQKQNERDLDRIERKANGPSEEGQDTPSTGPEDEQLSTEGEQPHDSYSNETPSQREKREQLEQRNRDQEERRREEDESHYGSGGGDRW